VITNADPSIVDKERLKFLLEPIIEHYFPGRKILDVVGHFWEEICIN
jgi:hypothetical protein